MTSRWPAPTWARPRPLGTGAAERRPSPGQLVALDVVAVVVAALAGVFTPPSQPLRLSGATWQVTAVAAWVAVSLGVLARRRAPAGALVVVLAAAAVGLFARSPAPGDYYLALVVYTVASTSARRRGVSAALLALAVEVAGSVLGGGRLVTVTAVGGGLTVAVGWLVGEAVRSAREQARRYRQLQAEQASAVVAEHQRAVARAVAAQRVELARELHDVVAHGMSLVAVRAGVARVVMDSQPAQAKEALDIIETTTRQTLHEMRLLVGVLRTGDDEAPAALGPAPGLDDVARLVAEAELAGVSVELRTAGAPRAVYPALGLSVYRIVGEALTNVVRHAGATRVVLTLAWRPGELEIDIRDDGPTGPGSSSPVGDRPVGDRPVGDRPVGDRPVGDRPVGTGATGGGNGLLGIRERAALFGGRASTGPDGGGFRVRVVLPTGEPGPGGDPGRDEARTPRSADLLR